jgi:GT2 family glycosyltransferase
MGCGAQTSMTVDASLVLVAHRSAAVAAEAIASFRRDCRRIGINSEVVVVDHSEDPGEAAGLSALRPENLLVLPNRGYAAGVNAGVAASRGRSVVLGNPDIRFEEGALAALLGALDAGWDVVGPQFVLAGLLFPPADLQTPGEELRRWAAARATPLWRTALRAEVRRWRRVWEASAPVAVPTLSGALLTFRRETAREVGRWDERYFLYFEETAWLRRAAGIGLRVGLVPAARVEHLWAHAADPRVYGDHFAASRRRFLVREFGWRGRLASRLHPAPAPLRPRPFPATVEELPGGRLLWLLSPTALGLPAAALEGEAPAFYEALRAVKVRRGGDQPYLAIAVRPDTCSPVGVWAVEVNDG